MNTVVITGVSRGIGRALAQKFLNEGYFVVGTSIDGIVDFSHENLKVFQLDLSKPDSIVSCVENIKGAGMKIDILHNNAGVMLDGEESDLKINNLRGTLEINLIGTIDFTERLIPLINKGGHIVNTTSAAGSLTDTELSQKDYYIEKKKKEGISRTAVNPYLYPSYKISKAALNMYTLILSARLKHEDFNIKVSSVHPGWVKTDMGGEEAPMTPEEAAGYIFKTATDKNLESGQFWFKGEKYPW